MPKSWDSYYQTVRYLEGLGNCVKPNNKKDPSLYLPRMEYFLRLLDNPHLKQQYLHITGTSGKSTVANALHQALVNSGYKTGLFTSPFVTTTIEKLVINNLYIAPDDFVRLVADIKPAIDQMHAECPYGQPSYFEIFTALALVYFYQQKCDWTVLEVGCGGRYDSTNVIPAPVAAIITNIGYDHTHILGKTLTKIAYEKGGIIKPGSHLYTTETRPHLRKLLAKICLEKQVPMTVAPFTGGYQNANQALVRAVSLDLRLPEAAVKSALEARLPARFEVMQQAPLVILDGAHNEAKLQTTIYNLARHRYRRLILIIALAENKLVKDSLTELVKKASVVITTRFQIKERKAMLLKDFLRWCQDLAGVYDQKEFKLFTDPHQALDYALSLANHDDAILVTGSFFLAGDLRTRWVSEDYILTHRTAFCH